MCPISGQKPKLLIVPYGQSLVVHQNHAKKTMLILVMVMFHVPSGNLT